jgi:hypothetical protein
MDGSLGASVMLWSGYVLLGIAGSLVALLGSGGPPFGYG